MKYGPPPGWYLRDGTGGSDWSYWNGEAWADRVPYVDPSGPNRRARPVSATVPAGVWALLGTVGLALWIRSHVLDPDLSGRAFVLLAILGYGMAWRKLIKNDPRSSAPPFPPRPLHDPTPGERLSALSATERQALHRHRPSDEWMPGWRPDPLDGSRNRWWNGSTWTHRVLDDPEPTRQGPEPRPDQ